MVCYRTLTSAEALLEMDEGQVVILDCRFSLADPAAGAGAYAAGHLPGARFADLERDLSAPVKATSGRHPLPDAERLAERCAEWGIGPGTQVVVYDDQSGAMAARAWWLLRWLGHEAVAVLDGGLAAWLEAGGALTDRQAQPEPAVFPVREQGVPTVTADELPERLNAGWVLVDARAAERFRGEVEPMDPVAGHVPGAVNRPFTANLDETGRFKTAAGLAVEWKALLGETPPERVIHMCGSGVTACHNLLAMEHAGLAGSSLYPGSWSEWIRDPARGVAVGE